MSNSVCLLVCLYVCLFMCFCLCPWPLKTATGLEYHGKIPPRVSLRVPWGYHGGTTGVPRGYHGEIPRVSLRVPRGYHGEIQWASRVTSIMMIAHNHLYRSNRVDGISCVVDLLRLKNVFAESLLKPILQDLLILKLLSVTCLHVNLHISY